MRVPPAEVGVEVKVGKSSVSRGEPCADALFLPYYYYFFLHWPVGSIQATGRFNQPRVLTPRRLPLPVHQRRRYSNAN